MDGYELSLKNRPVESDAAKNYCETDLDRLKLPKTLQPIVNSLSVKLKKFKI